VLIGRALADYVAEAASSEGAAPAVSTMRRL